MRMSCLECSMKHNGCVPVALSGSPSSRWTSDVPVMNRPLGAASTSSGKRASVYVDPNALYVPSGVNTSTSPSTSPWVMVTAYFASSCWISTRSSVRDGVILEDLTALHYKSDVLCNADVGQWVAGNRDDVREVALGDPAEIGFVDQVRRDDGGRPQHRFGRHPPIDQRDQLVGVLPVRDGRCVGADGDLHARFVCGFERRARLREHLGGLVLQLLRSLRYVHRLGEPPRRDEKPVVVDEHLDRFVVHQEAVLDAVDSAVDGVLDGFRAVSVCGYPQPAPVRLVDDGAQFFVRIVLRASRSGQRHHTTRDAYLDQLRSVLDLVADRLADLVDPVGDALLDRELESAGHEGGEHRRIKVPARRRDGMARGYHPRPLYPPRVNGFGQRHVEKVSACLDEQSEVADGGEAGAQRPPGVADRAQHAGRRIILNLGQAGVFAAAAHQKVDLHVHQAGKQDGVAQVDYFPFKRTTQADDPVVLDTDDGGPDDLAGIDVEQTRCF